MKRLTTISLIALMAVLAGSPSYAQYHQNGNGYSHDVGHGFGFGANFGTGYGVNFGNINATQAKLQTRINRGIQSGRLNAREAAKLNAKLAQIASVEASMRASGNRLTFRERTKLLNQLASLNSEITVELNDVERRRIGYWTGNHYNH